MTGKINFEQAYTNSWLAQHDEGLAHVEFPVTVFVVLRQPFLFWRLHTLDCPTVPLDLKRLHELDKPLSVGVLHQVQT